MEKFIRIAVEETRQLDIDKIVPFQGDLVEMSADNRAKLKTEILMTGFAFVLHVWRNPEDGTVCLLDGHQRVSVLKDLRKDGWAVPPIPVAFVEAPSVKDAKKRILQARSQYGHMTAQGLYDFTMLNDISVDEIKVSFDFPQIDMQKFNKFFEAPSEGDRVGSTEIDPSSVSHLIHTCPECGHRFGKGGGD